MRRPRASFESFSGSCRGKFRHANRRHAVGAMRVLQKETKATTLNAYKCRTCRGWHVGKWKQGARSGGSGAGS
jgi:hypothetical protein